MPTSDDEVIIETHGTTGVATLNRPNALNALTLEMIRILGAAIQRWADDDRIRAIILRNEGGRAFSAGGDIKAAYTAGMDYRRGNAVAPALYFAEEYQLDLLIQHTRKSTIALIDGICMGGGFGIAAPCRYRVVTENTRFAMPEVGIGFFPDVGSLYFLSRAPSQFGNYLALTGNAIGGGDMIAAGLATHYVPAASLKKLGTALQKAKEGEIEDILANHAAVPPPGDLTKHQDMIAKCFAGATIWDILQTLEWEEGEFAALARATILSRAPLSVMVTLAHLQRSAGLSYDTVIARDFGIAQQLLERPDFYEGVRAAVIDKDRAPRWNPARLEDVTEGDIAHCLSPAARSLDEFVL